MTPHLMSCGLKKTRRKDGSTSTYRLGSGGSSVGGLDFLRGACIVGLFLSGVLGLGGLHGLVVRLQRRVVGDMNVA
jgi:hypothetical protein